MSDPPLNGPRSDLLGVMYAWDEPIQSAILKEEAQVPSYDYHRQRLRDEYDPPLIEKVGEKRSKSGHLTDVYALTDAGRERAEEWFGGEVIESMGKVADRVSQLETKVSKHGGEMDEIAATVRSLVEDVEHLSERFDELQQEARTTGKNDHNTSEGSKRRRGRR